MGTISKTRKGFVTIFLTLLSFFLLLGTPMLSTVSAQSTPVAFSGKQNLSNNIGNSTAPVIASVGSNVYVAWVDNTNGQAATTFRSSYDGGVTWNSPIQFLLSGKAHNEEMVAEGKYVFLSWEQNGFVMFAASSNKGSSFNTPLIMSTFLSTSPIVRASGPNVYLVWVKSPRNGIYISISHDYGQTFPIAQQSLIPGAYEPEIGVQGSSNVYVVSAGIFFTYSHNNGTSFSPIVRISQPGFSGTQAGREAMVSASGSYVYVTYTSNMFGPYHAYVVISNDSGVSFALPKDLTGTFASAREIQQDSAGSNVYVTYRGQQNSSSNVNQYISVSNDNGTTFSKPFDLAVQKKGQIGFGGVVANGTDAYALWPHEAKGRITQMFFEASQDQGATWGGAQQLSFGKGATGMNDPGDSGPMLSVSGGHIYIVWQDSSTGNGDIYFVVST